MKEFISKDLMRNFWIFRLKILVFVWIKILFSNGQLTDFSA